LTLAIDNIEHLESTTINGQAIVKIYLQPRYGPGTCLTKQTGEIPDTDRCKGV
jgi:hypothetical protein